MILGVDWQLGRLAGSPFRYLELKDEILSLCGHRCFGLVHEVNSIARDSHKSYYNKHIFNPGVVYLK